MQNLCGFSISDSTQEYFYVFMYVMHVVCAQWKVKTTHFPTNREAVVSKVSRAVEELTEPFNQLKQRHQNR